jgi:hypothetical protein
MDREMAPKQAVRIVAAEESILPRYRRKRRLLEKWAIPVSPRMPMERPAKTQYCNLSLEINSLTCVILIPIRLIKVSPFQGLATRPPVAGSSSAVRRTLTGLTDSRAAPWGEPPEGFVSRGCDLPSRERGRMSFALDSCANAKCKTTQVSDVLRKVGDLQDRSEVLDGHVDQSRLRASCPGYAAPDQRLFTCAAASGAPFRSSFGSPRRRGARASAPHTTPRNRG